MSDLTIQFLAFDGCPLAEAAKANLERALSDCGVTGYRTVDILDPATPEELRGWGSPTILVNGVDVGGQGKGDGVGCRIYPGAERVPRTRALGSRRGHSGVQGALTQKPSFLFILIGGPAVEASREDIKLTAPLTGITAAVVGVILSLAVFFGWHVFWPEATVEAPLAGRFEWFSVLLASTALLALWRFRAGVVTVIVACGVAGLLYSLRS